MMETQAQSPHRNRLPSLLARPWVIRLTATLGIVLMTVGVLVPAAGRELIVYSDAASRFSEMWTIGNSIGTSLSFLRTEHTPHASWLAGYAVYSVVYSILTLGGLALIPLLWQPHSRRGNATMRWVYAVWLVLLTILAIAGLPAWRQFMSQPPSEQLRRPITWEVPYILPGVIVFPLGVLVSAAALALMLRKPLPLSLPAPRTGWQWTAALVLTAGVIVWVVGFYVMPEAVTAACPPVTFSLTQFAHGACAGLDSDQVLQAAAYHAGLNPISRLLYQLGGNFALLVAVGCITALGGWTRHLPVPTLAWLAAWPLLAAGVALVALLGVVVIARQSFRLTAATGPGWHVAAGMIVTFAGIGLVMLGQLGLWRELVRRKVTASTQQP